MRLLMIFVLLSLMSCGSDPAVAITLDRDAIIGQWDIISASRDGKETSTLADAHMRVDQNGQLYTNLMGSEGPHQISWQDSLVISADSSQLYKIENLTSDSLYVSFRLQRHSFQLTFARGVNDETE